MKHSFWTIKAITLPDEEYPYDLTAIFFSMRGIARTAPFIQYLRIPCEDSDAIRVILEGINEPEIFALGEIMLSIVYEIRDDIHWWASSNLKED